MYTCLKIYLYRLELDCISLSTDSYDIKLLLIHYLSIK